MFFGCLVYRHEILAGLLIRIRYRYGESDSAAGGGSQKASSDIRSHDDDRVAEINRPALTVCKPPVVQDLQHGVEDLRMCLLDLVEKHHRVRTPPYLLGQLAAFFVSHISRRRPDQLGYVVLFHVFRHIHPDQSILIPEHNLRKSTGQLGLTDTGRSEEDEGTGRTLRILKSQTASANRFRNRRDRFILSDDTFSQLILKSPKSLGIRLVDLRHRYSRPARHNIGNVVGG